MKYYLPYSEANKVSFARDVVICQIALGFFKGMNLRAIKPALIEEFKKARLKTKTQHDTPRKPATVQRELSIVSKIFSLALEHNFVDSNPCSRVKKLRFDNTCTRKLSESDEPKFFAAFESEWAHDVCLFILNTALRQGDALGLQPKHVDWQNEQIRLLQGKTQRVITIPMNDTVQTLVKKWLAKKGEYVFVSPKSGTRGVSVKKAIEGACRRGKVPALTVRDLRRTAATRLLERGANHLSIAKFLGHSDLRVLPRYAQPDQALKDAAKLLEKPNPTKTLPETGSDVGRIAVSR